MKGRSVEGVLRQVERWHRELNRATIESQLRGPAAANPGYERIEGTEGSQTMVRIDEIVTSAELQQEGRAMRHCDELWTLPRGTSAIFRSSRTLGAGSDRRLTIQLDVPSKSIVPARRSIQCAAPTARRTLYLGNLGNLGGIGNRFILKRCETVPHRCS